MHNSGASRTAHLVVVCPTGGADRKLSPSQRRIVLALYRRGRPMTVRELGDLLGHHSPGSTFPLITKLRARGFLLPAIAARRSIRLAPDVVVGSGGFIGRVVALPSARGSALTPR